MFKPRFRYTNKIVRSLTQISAAREVILNSPVIGHYYQNDYEEGDEYG